MLNFLSVYRFKPARAVAVKLKRIAQYYAGFLFLHFVCIFISQRHVLTLPVRKILGKFHKTNAVLLINVNNLFSQKWRVVLNILHHQKS